MHPNAPLNLKTANLTASSVDLSWDAVEGAKSYVIHYGVKGTTADRMHYSETPTFTLNDTVFAGTLAGVSLDVYVQTFNETFEGTTEIEQAQNANANGHGSAWSDLLEVTFPAAVQTVAEIKAVLDEKGISYSSTAKKSELEALLNGE